MSEVLHFLAGFVGGIVAWCMATFFGKPLSRFFELRQEASELIFMTVNITTSSSDDERATKAEVDLRRVAARIDAIRQTASAPLLGVIKCLRYDLPNAVGGLTGLSNAMARRETVSGRAFHRSSASQGLRLRTYAADQQTLDALRKVEAGKRQPDG